MNLSHNNAPISEDTPPNFGIKGAHDASRRAVIPQDPHRDVVEHDFVEHVEKTKHYDVWYYSFEKIFEFFHFPLCFGIKAAMIVLNLSTTCVFLATCLIISLKLILCVENGIIAGETNSFSAQLFMLFCLQFMVLVTWAYATAIIISRQFEVLSLIFIVPVSLSSLKLQQMAAEEEDHTKQQFLRFTTPAVDIVPYPVYPILTSCLVIMLLLILITIICYGVGLSSVASFFLVLFLITLTFVTMWFTPTPRRTSKLHVIDRLGYSMVSWAFLFEWIFMSVGGIVTAALFVVDFGSSDEPYGGLPAFGKLNMFYGFFLSFSR